MCFRSLKIAKCWENSLEVVPNEGMISFLEEIPYSSRIGSYFICSCLKWACSVIPSIFWDPGVIKGIFLISWSLKCNPPTMTLCYSCLFGDYFKKDMFVIPAIFFRGFKTSYSSNFTGPFFGSFLFFSFSAWESTLVYITL